MSLNLSWLSGGFLAHNLLKPASGDLFLSPSPSRDLTPFHSTINLHSPFRGSSFPSHPDPARILICRVPRPLSLPCSDPPQPSKDFHSWCNLDHCILVDIVLPYFNYSPFTTYVCVYTHVYSTLISLSHTQTYTHTRKYQGKWNGIKKV